MADAKIQRVEGTPLIGIAKRVTIGAFLLWMAVLAIALLRIQR